MCVFLIPLPPGIMRERALAETDLGTLAPGGCLSPALSGRRVAGWGSAEGLDEEPSGLSTPSPLDGSWSRSSEKLPDDHNRLWGGGAGGDRRKETKMAVNSEI